jgi:hypothetical protein
VDAVVTTLEDRAGRVFLEEALLHLPPCGLSGRIPFGRAQRQVIRGGDPEQPLPGVGVHNPGVHHVGVQLVAIAAEPVE